ncbi:Pterin-4-alpha-carbinolamine dehydratase [Ceratocystis lukuohia]|uniref:Pterin-4-alpha-carbinolamine dehydratase n=1 Tax=Ceratocystis lukuohia TaxID=2019550 RepID=A0ABR4MAE1_9PEZI
MPSAGPAPSRAAINTLRSIIFGTSCSLALVAEERRRRTDIAWTLVENGRLLRSQRCYHSGGLATVRAKFDSRAVAAPVSASVIAPWEDATTASEWHADRRQDHAYQNLQDHNKGRPSAGGGQDMIIGVGGYASGLLDVAGPLRENLQPRRSISAFENTKSLDAYMIAQAPRTGAEKRQALADEIEAEQNPLRMAMNQLALKLEEPGASSRELQKLLDTAYEASDGLRTLPTGLLEMSRSVQYILRTRGNSEAAARALLRLVEDPRVEGATLLSHYPGDVIGEILSIEDMLYMSVPAKITRFQLAGSILAGINSAFRASHRKRHARMCDIICRVLQLDSDGEISGAFLSACGSQASQIAHDIGERYTAKYPADVAAQWQACRQRHGLVYSPLKIRYVNPPRHTPAIDALIGSMKLSIQNGRLNDAISAFEDHIKRKGRRSNACLALALQSADTLSAEPLCKRSLRLLRKAAHAKYNIEEEMSRLIAKRFDHLEKITPEANFKNGQMYAHVSSLLASMRDFCRNPGFLAYNRMARACLATRDYIGAIRLCLDSIRKHGQDDLFSHAFVISNLVFALSALGEYNLLHVLLLLLDHSPLKADDTVRRALIRARKRLAIAAGSALWDKTRAQHMMGERIVNEACLRMSEWRRSTRAEVDTKVVEGPDAGDTKEAAPPPTETAEAISSYSLEPQAHSTVVETEFGRFSAIDFTTLLRQVVNQWKVLTLAEEAEAARAQMQAQV